VATGFEGSVERCLACLEDFLEHEPRDEGFAIVKLGDVDLSVVSSGL